MNGQKRFFLIFIFIIIFLLFIPCVVKADVSNYCKEKGYNQETDTYDYEYCLYLNSEFHKGFIKIPKSIYDSEPYWFINVYSDSLSLICTSKNLVVASYISSNQNFVFSNIKCAYDVDSEGLVSTKSHNLTMSGCWYFVDRILYTHDVMIRINSPNDSGFNHYHSMIQQNISLKTPSLSYMSDKGFRLKLNDFYGNTFSDEFGFDIVRGLQKVSISIKDLSNNNNIFADDNIFSFTGDVEQAEDGSYYVDLLFSGYLNMLHNKDGEYLITITPYYNSYKVFPNHSKYKEYASSITFHPDIYVKYSYKKDTNSGILVEVDENGNDIDHGGDKPPEGTETDKTQEAINNQTQKIEEQTNAIKEQTEVSKNIFQQIIELPR